MGIHAPRRGDRRHAMFAVAARRRLKHLQRVHPEFLRDPRPEHVDCVCELSRHYFAKRTPGGGQSKRIRGRPKYGHGNRGRRFAVDVRIMSHRLESEVERGQMDPEEAPGPCRFWGQLTRKSRRGRPKVRQGPPPAGGRIDRGGTGA